MAYSLKSVVKGASIYSVGQIFIRAGAFLLLPLYTRFLSPSDYGMIGFLMMINQILSVILLFGFHAAQSRYLYQFKNNTTEIGIYLFSINSFLIVVSGISCVLLTFSGEKIFLLLKIQNIPFNKFGPLIIWTVFFNIMNQMVISYAMANKNYRKCITMEIILFCITNVLIIFFVAVQREYSIGYIKALLLSNILFFILFYPLYIKKFKFIFKLQFLNNTIIYGIPIVFHTLASTIHTSIDRGILESKVTIDSLGIYTIGYQIGMIMTVIITSINKSWQPNYFDLMSDSLENHTIEIHNIFNPWLAIISIICCIGMLFSREILYIMTPFNYHEAAFIVPFIIYGYFLEGFYFFFSSPLLFYNKTISFPVITTICATLNILLNIVFIPLWGIYGAAIATIISLGMQSILAYFIGIKYHNPHYNIIKILLTLFLTGIIGFSFVWRDIGILNFSFKFIALLFFITFNLFINKKYLFASYKKIT